MHAGLESDQICHQQAWNYTKWHMSWRWCQNCMSDFSKQCVELPVLHIYINCFNNLMFVLILLFQNEESITLAMHDSLVDRLRSWNRFYALSPETFFLAVNTLDRFLSLVKVKSGFSQKIYKSC